MTSYAYPSSSLLDAVRQQAQLCLGNSAYRSVGEQMLADAEDFVAAVEPLLTLARRQYRRPLLNQLLWHALRRDADLLDEVMAQQEFPAEQMLWNAIARNFMAYIDDWRAYAALPMSEGYSPVPVSRLEYLVVVDAEVGVATEIALVEAASSRGKFDAVAYQWLKS